MVRRGVLVLLVLGVVSGCSGNKPSATSVTPSLSPSATAANAAGFTVTSRDLAAGHWPAAATCDGANNPPDLKWTAGPSGTASYALQLFDPDAPNGGFTHWMLANEPPNVRQPTPGSGVSGNNDFGVEGFKGPCPPRGMTHHYVLTVYAVDAVLSLPRLYSHREFQQALAGHVLAQANVTATYGR